MRKQLILEAKAEAERFLQRVKELDAKCPLVVPPKGREALNHSEKPVSAWYDDTGWECPVEVGAVRRASLDLWRALAKMRRS